MSDSISRQGVIDILCRECGNGCTEWECKEIKSIKGMPSADRPNNKVHLCNSCQRNYPDCSAKQDDVIFGDGTGNDNICCCAKYEAVDRPTGKWIKSEFQKKEDIQNENYLYNCSECGHGDLHAKGQIVPYCWWCGAWMEVSDE